MKRLGIIGWPVTQSRSPRMFYDTFAGRQDILSEYSYDLIIEQSFEKAFGIFDREFFAVNVTAPFKEPAFRAAGRASELCRGIGATNLLIHRDEGVMAYNTDCLAVVRILEEQFRGASEGSLTQSLPKVLVAGCGGAGKAAIVAALSVGAEVTVANRTASATESFMKYLADNGTPGTLHSVPLSAMPEQVRLSGMVIYTLPLPVPELPLCDFTGRTVLEAKYFEPAIKQMPGMTYIPGSEWFRIQALETYRLLGLEPSCM